MLLKTINIFQEGSNINQITCAVLINMPVFAYGASMGWISPMTLLLQTTNSPKGVPLTDAEVSWIASVAYLVGAFASVLLAMMGDRIGRKRTLIFVSLIGSVGWILMLSSMNIWVMIIARMFVGVTMAGSYVICPVYTKEISSDNVRGSLGCLPMAFHTTGNLFLYVIGDLLDYNTVLWICLGIPLIHIILFTTMPESPSYLVKKGKVEEAIDALLWLRCKKQKDQSIQEEIGRIITEQNNDEQTKYTGCKAIRNDPILSKAFNITLVAILARDLCGVITFLNFAGEIFTISSEGTGIVLTPNQQAMVLGSVQVLASITATSTIEKAGRRILFSSTGFLSGLSMIVVATWFLLKDLNIIFSSWIPVTALCVCVFCDSAGLLPASCVIANELFSFKYRAIVLAVTLTLANFIDFFQVILFKPVTKYVGIYYIFYFFGIFCLTSTLYIIVSLPETKKRSLEDIYKDMGKKIKNTNEVQSNEFNMNHEMFM